MKIQFANERVTNFETYGDKSCTPILLIHGLGADLSAWHNQIQEFPKKGYFVIAMDMYGHGESSNLESDNLEEWNIQIVSLLEYLKIDKIVICGVSMGGVIAQNFTITHSEKIMALIVSDSFAELKTINEKLLGISQIIGFKIFKVLGRKIFAKAMADAYKEEFASTARKYMYNQSLKADFSQLLKARKAINRINVLSHLKNLTIPCLVTVGICFGKTFINVNQKIAHAIPNSQFIQLENSMDPSPLVNPNAFNFEVIRFLRKTIT